MVGFLGDKAWTFPGCESQLSMHKAVVGIQGMPAGAGPHDMAPGFKALRKTGIRKEWRHSPSRLSLYRKTKMLASLSKAKKKA